jgi:hypothetical protein
MESSPRQLRGTIVIMSVMERECDWRTARHVGLMVVLVPVRPPSTHLSLHCELVVCNIAFRDEIFIFLPPVKTLRTLCVCVCLFVGGGGGCKCTTSTFI